MPMLLHIVSPSVREAFSHLIFFLLRLFRKLRRMSLIGYFFKLLTPCHRVDYVEDREDLFFSLCVIHPLTPIVTGTNSSRYGEFSFPAQLFLGALAARSLETGTLNTQGWRSDCVIINKSEFSRKCVSR